MRAAIIVYLLLLLSIIDRVTTWVAIDSNLGEETNPHVNTDNLVSIFLSPVPLFYGAIMLGIVALTEVNSSRIHALLLRNHPLSPLFLLPLFCILMLSVISISNTLGALGLGTPLAWFAGMFQFITADRHALITIALAVINIAALPILKRIAIRIYAPVYAASAGGPPIP